MSFHEIRFPTGIALASEGGPERRTEVTVLGSGREERNARWSDSRRRYNAGYGLKSLEELYAVLEFFEERRGRLYGFRWKDHADYKSCSPGNQVSSVDQTIGTGDGSTTGFQLIKTYGELFAPFSRTINKPVTGTVSVSVDSVEQVSGIDYTIDYSTGQVSFQSGSVPVLGAVVTAGYEFDVPVRFDTDVLKIDLSRFSAGSIPDIPIVEVRL